MRSHLWLGNFRVLRIPLWPRSEKSAQKLKNGILRVVSRFERDEEGNLIKEATIPFEYHDGYLSVYYQSNNYQEVEKELSPLQEEALWCAIGLWCRHLVHKTQLP